jgi:hypothetical protein
MRNELEDGNVSGQREMLSAPSESVSTELANATSSTPAPLTASQ